MDPKCDPRPASQYSHVGSREALETLASGGNRAHQAGALAVEAGGLDTNLVAEATAQVRGREMVDAANSRGGQWSHMPNLNSCCLLVSYGPCLVATEGMWKQAGGSHNECTSPIVLTENVFFQHCSTSAMIIRG